jgi:hypothetical protein
MQNHQMNPDDAIDKTLAALRDAAPPEGMQARIAHRLQQPAAVAAHSRWRHLLTGSTLSAAWGRGALTGAATALLIVGALLLAQHGLRTKPEPEHYAIGEIAAARNAAPAITPVSSSARTLPIGEARANLCASTDATAGAQRARRALPAYRDQTLRDARFAPSHPAPVLPLTAQERALVELARTANPTVLAALNSETQARMEAEDAAEFNKFFAPPPAPPQPKDNGSTTKSNENESLL